MYNLLEYGDKYSMISGSLLNYYRNLNDDANEDDAAINRINKNKAITSKSFESKTKIIGRTPADNKTLDTEVDVSLKYLSNFWRFISLSLINFEIELDLSCSEECIIFEMSKTSGIASNPSVQARVAIQTTKAISQINIAKLYVPIVTFSINDNIIFFENRKQGFKRTISWNKYRSEITTQPKKIILSD